MTRQNEIDLLIEQMYQANVVYRWDFEGIGGTSSPLIRWLFSIVAGLFLPTFLMVVGDPVMWSAGFWFCLILATMGVLMTRYLFFPDKHYCYQLTAMGIHYTVKDMIPDIAYTIVRGFAWLGIGVCIIAGFMLGPLAFVGAGAFALMSFGMTNFQPTLEKHCVLIDDCSVIFDLINDNVLSISTARKGEYAYVGDIYTTSPEQKKQLLTQLTPLYPAIEFVEIKRRKDEYKHPIYQRNESEFVE